MAAQPASPPATTVIYLRLWMTEEPGGSKRLPRWDDGTPLVRLLQEILCFHGAVPSLVEDAGGLLLAHCADEVRAVRIARQVQALVTGFAGIAEPRTVAASIAIVPPSRTGSADVAADLQAYLQQRAQPAQILFASSSGETASSTSALTSAFKTQALPSPEPRLQLFELLWRYKDRAAAAAVQAHGRAAKQRQGLASVPAPLPTPKLAQPSLAERSRDLREDTATALSTVKTKLHGWLSRISRAAASPSGQFVFRSRYRWGGLAAAFAVLAVVFLLVHRRLPKAVGSVTPTETALAANIARTPTVAMTGKSSVPPRAAAPELSERVPASEKRSTARPEPIKKADEEPERVVRDHGGLSSEQTRQVLSRGQTQLDRGCYALAIGYFRRVLEDDPRNGAASSGIEKARKRMQLDSLPKAACQ